MMQRYDGTAMLCTLMAVMGWLSIASGIIMFLFKAKVPLAIHFGLTGIATGLFMVVIGCLGNVLVDLANTLMKQGEAQAASQVHQLKAAEATLAVLKDRA